MPHGGVSSKNDYGHSLVDFVLCSIPRGITIISLLAFSSLCTIVTCVGVDSKRFRQVVYHTDDIMGVLSTHFHVTHPLRGVLKKAATLSAVSNFNFSRFAPSPH